MTSLNNTPIRLDIVYLLEAYENTRFLFMQGQILSYTAYPLAFVQDSLVAK